MKFVLILLLLLIPLGAYAADGSSTPITLYKDIAVIAKIAFYGLNAAGIILLAVGILQGKRAGSSHRSITKTQVVSTMITGVLLMSFGTVTYLMSNTVVPTTYLPASSTYLNDSFTQLLDEANQQASTNNFVDPDAIKSILAFIWLVGMFSYAKAIFLMQKIGSGHSPQREGAVKPILSHIAGGMVCTQLKFFFCLIFSKIFIFQSICP